MISEHRRYAAQEFTTGKLPETAVRNWIGYLPGNQVAISGTKINAAKRTASAPTNGNTPW